VDAGLFTARSLPQLMLQRFGPARHHPAVITRPSSWRPLSVFYSLLWCRR